MIKLTGIHWHLSAVVALNPLRNIHQSARLEQLQPPKSLNEKKVTWDFDLWLM